MNQPPSTPTPLSKRILYPPKGELENNEEVWSVNIGSFKPAVGNNNLSNNISAFNKPAMYKPTQSRVKTLFKKPVRAGPNFKPSQSKVRNIFRVTRRNRRRTQRRNRRR